MITFEIEINQDGDAVIRFPEGPGQQVDAAKAAELTEKIAAKLGKIAERHVGEHHHHDHGVDHRRDHLSH